MLHVACQQRLPLGRMFLHLSLEGVETMAIVGRLPHADELLNHNEIRVEPDGGGPAVRIQVPRGLMSEIVKPMGGRRIAVKVNKRGDEFEYVDIDELE